MRIWTCPAALCGAILFAAAPAGAQQATVMKSFNWSEARSILDEVKAKVTGEKEADGLRYLEADTEGGMHFRVYGYECDSKEQTQRCTGLYFYASFTIKEDRMNDALNAVVYNALADYAGTDGRFKLARYVILDDGVTRANLVTNARIFIELSDKVWDLLTDGGYFPPS